MSKITDFVNCVKNGDDEKASEKLKEILKEKAARRIKEVLSNS